MQSSRLKHVTRIMEWGSMSRACLPLALLIALYAMYLGWALLMRHVDSDRTVLNMAAFDAFTTLLLGAMAGALLLFGIGLLLRRWQPDAVWFQHVSANYYGLSLVLGGYFVGLLNMITGAVLMGSPIVGFLLLERRVVLIAAAIAFMAVLALNVAAAWDYLPYAPLLLAPQDTRSALLWAASQLAFAVPFMLSSVAQVITTVGHWREREARVLALSLSDALTGAPNRRSILALLERELAHAHRQRQPLALVVLDLDHFKRINDCFGHPVGDRVLKASAEALAGCIRPGDALGRFGGEEFLLVLPNATPVQAAQVVARCRERLAALDLAADSGEPVPVRASFGLAWVEAGQTAGSEALIRAADAALYAAKAGGRDRLVSAPAPCCGGAAVRASRQVWRELRQLNGLLRLVAGVLEWSPVAKTCLVLGLLLFMELNYWAYLTLILQLDTGGAWVEPQLTATLRDLTPGMLIATLLLLALGSRLKARQPAARWFQYLGQSFFALVLVSVGYTIGILHMPTGVMLLCSVLLGVILFERRIVLPVFFGALGVVVALAFASALGWLPYAPMLAGTAWQETSPFWLLSNYLFTTWAMLVVLVMTDRMLGRWREREAEVQALSQTDPLTQVGNRRWILDQLERELRQTTRSGAPLALVLLDLDHFKKINDAWGHPTGDRVLQAAARSLTGTLRQGDAIGRYGGEEFMLLLRDTPRDGALALLERCREALLAAAVPADNGELVQISASFGLACSDGRPGQDAEALIRAADQALYRAKAAGRNRVEMAELLPGLATQ